MYRRCEDRADRARDIELDRLSPGTAPDVWSRPSKWILFVHTYWAHLPGFRASDELIACEIHSRIILMFVTHTETDTVIVGTRRIVARFSWLFVVGLRDPMNFEEIVDGIGGSLPDLVSVLIHYIQTLPMLGHL
ncbi:hypothetical protein DFH09DRAFT_1309875 [Mycena vulgaris]|nr:hypothetical protein DFH09DRAFT_1309875 [Mycena vulgaris]